MRGRMQLNRLFRHWAPTIPIWILSFEPSTNFKVKINKKGFVFEAKWLNFFEDICESMNTLKGTSMEIIL